MCAVAGGGGDRALVGVLDGEAAPQDLQENLPELPGGQVVEEGIDDRAEVEEGVAHGVEKHVGPEEGGGPPGLGQRRHHQAADLHGEPAEHQGGHDEACKDKVHLQVDRINLLRREREHEALLLVP